MSKRPQDRFSQAHIYQENFVSKGERKVLLEELKQFYPIWEERYSKSNPPPEGQPNRWLLRPVYWLGNWQFACLNYYHPPKGIEYRCVKAEPFPDTMQKLVNEIEAKVRNQFLEKDVPRFWKLNTCLINYYGHKLIDGKKVEFARVGEHKDFEPGPVASLSFGEKALLQFVKSDGKHSQSQVVQQQWLEDSSLQIFGGDRYKKQLFHRVQRVEDKGFVFNENHTGDYVTRRINLTFRYVPDDHIYLLNRLPAEKQADIAPYIQQLAGTSPYFKKQII